MNCLLTPLPSIAALLASGPQARDLLQAQLTQDLHKLGPDHGLPAAYCSPQGRMLSDFVLLPRGDQQVLMLLHPTLLEPMLKRLRLFILRLQCRLEPVELAAHGLLLRAGATLTGIDLPDRAWALRVDHGLTLLRLPDAPQQQRVLVLADGADALARLTALRAGCASGSEADWQLAAIRAGQPSLSAATTGLFVPQMLNQELLGAIDFKKGCYPGQEVVARTAYRGTIKRRCYRLACPVQPAPGAEIVDAADPGQPCGVIVNAAPTADGWEALAELKIDAAMQGILHLVDAGGPLLRRLDLPYPLDPVV